MEPAALPSPAPPWEPFDWYREVMFPPQSLARYRVADDYTAQCCLEITREIGLEARLAKPTALSGAFDQLGIDPGARPLFARAVQVLCDYGFGRLDSAGMANLDLPDSLFDKGDLRSRTLPDEPTMESAFRLADLVTELAIPLASRQVNDRDVRAGGAHTDFFLECPVGREPSEFGGAAVAEIVRRRNADVSILDLGGGTMSAAEGALGQLAKRGLSDRVGAYVFTELNPSFVLRAKRLLPEAHPWVGEFTFKRLDFSKPFGSVGLEPSSFDIVLSVNALQCARNLGATLREIHRVLRPGGSLIVTQYTRVNDGSAVPFVDFVCDPLASYWDVELDPDLRPTHGVATAATWRRSVRAAGFEAVEILPDERLGLEWFRSGGVRHYVASFVARKPLA